MPCLIARDFGKIDAKLETRSWERGKKTKNVKSEDWEMKYSMCMLLNSQLRGVRKIDYPIR